MCYDCIAEFQKVVKLKRVSLETQAKLVHMKSLELYVAPVNKSSGTQLVPIRKEHMALLAKVTFQAAEPERRGSQNGSCLDKMEIEETKPKDWKCPICPKHFPRNQESRLKLHVKWHKLALRLKCPMCRFFCRSKVLLNYHKRAVHPLVKCSYCTKSIRKHLLHRHINKHLEKCEPEMANKPSLLQQSVVSVSPVASTSVGSPMIVTSPAKKAPAANVAAATEIASPAPGVTRRYSRRVASATGSSSPLEPSNKLVVPRKSYLCCEKTFDRKTELVQHVKRHTHPRI